MKRKSVLGLFASVMSGIGTGLMLFFFLAIMTIVVVRDTSTFDFQSFKQNSGLDMDNSQIILISLILIGAVLLYNIVTLLFSILGYVKRSEKIYLVLGIIAILEALTLLYADYWFLSIFSIIRVVLLFVAYNQTIKTKMSEKKELFGNDGVDL